MSENQTPSSPVPNQGGNGGVKPAGGNNAPESGKGNSPSISIPERRGPGRPRKDGSPISSAGPAAAKKPAKVDPELAKVIVSTLIQLIRVGDDFYAKHLLATVRTKLPADVQPLFFEQLKAAAFSDRDEALLSPILHAVVCKYDIFAKMGPEAMALLWLAQYGIRMAGVTNAINKAADKLKAPKKPDEPKASGEKPNA